MLRRRDRAGQQPARVVAQVEHQSLQWRAVLLDHVFQRLGEIFAGVLLELGDTTKP